MKRYNPSEIEPKWQKNWEEQKTYKAHDDSQKPKYYALSMFPYPSGLGLHIGHVRNFTITDVASRFMRMQGHEVMQPFGWDSFGLPAENYAIQTGTPPQVVTKQNTDNFRHQLKRMGFGIDWDREFASTDPDYYKWTQWFFLLLLKRGLAYQKESAQFWCDECKTVLANEQVVNGCCWRHEDKPVTKKFLKQWFFKITDYADRLEADLADLDWPEGIKAMQRNWIGRSTGAEVDFKLDKVDETIKVFTTRADTLFGATFLVLAPESKLAKQITTAGHKADVDMYIRTAETKTDIDRMDESRRKTGVFTGAYATNPVNGAKLPIWVADYVLGGYGTGAIMAVPAHDQRDHDFAKRFNLPITPVVAQDFGDILPNTKDIEGVVVIGYDPKTKQFMSLKKGDKTLLVSGGREEGESLGQTARRELQEEAGFEEVQALLPLGDPVYSYYFNPLKNINRRSLGHNYLAIIDPSAQGQTYREAHEIFEVQWTDFETLRAGIETLGGGVGHWLDALNRAKDAIENYHQGNDYKAACYGGEGTLINSGQYNGLSTSQAREKIIADLAGQNSGQERVNYKIRDWLISRQRYWGAPIPIVHCKNCGVVPVPEDKLPVELPILKDFAPSGDGRSPLAKVEDWVKTECPKCAGPAERETDTMDGFACSSWYFLRFADPHNNQQAFSQELAEKWLPVDTYVGGAEHAVMHLLYARMWTKVMFDEGLISFDEPFKALRNQGMLLATDGTKFSKSKGNGVDPVDIIDSGYGADALRSVMVFLAPFDQKTPWSPETLGGVHRFLNRIWTLAQEAEQQKTGEDGENTQIKRAVHKTIKKITADMHEMGYNTAISSLMELINALYKLRENEPIDKNGQTWSWAIKTISQLIAPFAPHLAEELWAQFGGQGSVHLSPWPVYDAQLLVEETVKIVVQVNGKVRANLDMPANTTKDEVEKTALANEHVQQFTKGQPSKKVIYVPGRLINIVV